MSALNHSANAGRHALIDRKDDLYETPPEATRALMAAGWPIPWPVWEPACGRGAIVKVLRESGRQVWATDLVSRDGVDRGRIDFLMETKLPLDDIRSIITNPPYKLAAAFVRKALDFKVPYVAMLLRLAFLEGSSRSDILEASGLTRVLVFRNRLPMMHRAGWQGKRAGSSIAFAWFIWERGHAGAPTIHRISWEKSR